MIFLHKVNDFGYPVVIFPLFKHLLIPVPGALGIPGINIYYLSSAFLYFAFLLLIPDPTENLFG